LTARRWPAAAAIDRTARQATCQIPCQLWANMIVLGPVRRHQWDERERLTMPSLLRLLTVIAILGAAVYGGLYALAHFVQPKSREITVSIPPDKFFKNH
jgi:hypothetical protein